MNLLTIIILLLFLCCAIDGYKKGFVQGLIHLVTMLLGLIVLYVLAKGIGNFMQGSMVHVVLALILLAAIGLIRKLVNLILESCKLVSKLPVVSWVDHLAGALLGVLQGLFSLWFLFIVLGFFDYFGFEDWVMLQIGENRLLSMIYHTNYMVHFLKAVMSAI